MCLAIPAQIVERDASRAREGGGLRRPPRGSTALVPEAQVGDWVLVHVGFALHTIDEEEARGRSRCSRRCELEQELRASETCRDTRRGALRHLRVEAVGRRRSRATARTALVDVDGAAASRSAIELVAPVAPGETCSSATPGIALEKVGAGP